MIDNQAEQQKEHRWFKANEQFGFWSVFFKGNIIGTYILFDPIRKGMACRATSS